MEFEMSEPSPEDIREAAPAALNGNGARSRRTERYASDPVRMLPQATDAEKGLLCSFLIDPQQIAGLCSEKKITSKHFFVPAHEEIYRCLRDMHEQQDPIDFITLTTFLRNCGRLDQCGGAAFTTELFSFIPTPANAPTYVEILLERYALREIIRVGTGFASQGYDAQQDPWELLDSFERAVLAIGQSRLISRVACDALELAKIGMHEIERILSRGSEIGGLSTGIGALDEMTDGLHEAELIVLGAVASVGKTALGMQIIESCALDAKIPCAVFSLEMSLKQVSKGMIYRRACVNPMPWRQGRPPSQEDIAAMHEASREIAASPLFVEDSNDCTIQGIRATARRLVREKGVRVILVDSLSALHSNTKQGRDNRPREAAECSEGCKNMAKELGVTVILVAHLDKDLTREQKPHPQHLRETAKLFQDADSVWLMWEPDFDSEAPALEPKINIWNPKQRDGEPFATRELWFAKRWVRFLEAPTSQKPAALPERELPL